MNSEITNINLPINKSVNLKPYDMKICPINLKLYGCEIDFSDVEIFARLKNDNEEAVFFISDSDANIYMSDGTILNGNQKDYSNYTYTKDNKKTQFIFLTRELADKSWFLGDKIIFNADYVLPNGAAAVENSKEIAYYDLKYKFGTKNCIVTELNNEKQLQQLEISKVEFCSPEIDTDFNYSDWKIIENKTDAFSCDMYNEFIWYKAQIPDNLSEITLNARHLFAVYINGKEVINRNSYKNEQLQDVPETISVPLNKSILTKHINELTILVQNLGFDKGFSGDTNNPRGLVFFETTPKIPVNFYVQENLSFERTQKYISENPYLAKITVEFDADFKDNVFFAKYISFENFRCRRATIFLNGIKIGRYIKRRNVQDKFYLINEFLKPHNVVDIVVWEKERNIKSKWGFKSELENVIILLGTFKSYQLFK